MSLRRFGIIFRQELSHTLKRPIFWFLIALILFFAWGMSTGNVRISSGDASVGGKKAWITSEFSFAFVLTFLISILYSFHASIASGMSIIADDEAKIREILGSTPLRPSEYVWGKFLAILTAFVLAMGIQVAGSIFFNHIVPNPEAAEIRGPLVLANYLRPALTLGLPALLFYLGAAFYLGERWRRPVTVFLLPTAILLVGAFFLWSWTPSWLDPRWNRLLMWLDPGGVRWLSETWLKLDRGADFYNQSRIGLDFPFVLSRLAFAGLGLLGVGLAQRHLSGQGKVKAGARSKPQPEVAAARTGALEPLQELRMRSGSPGLLSGLRTVAGVELRGLLAAPGIYLFGVLILIQTLGTTLIAVGPFQTELLTTSGFAAAQGLNTLSLLLCLLLLFYTVESIEREVRAQVAPLTYSTPVSTGALLFGKVLANSAVGGLMAFATFVGCAVAILIQGRITPVPGPFVLIWGLLLLPTVFVWSAFVTALQSLFGQRFLTYSLALGVLSLTFYLQFTRHMSWVGNWWLWDAVRWTDLGPLQLDRRALVLNRLTWIGIGVLLIYVAAHSFRRRQPDAVGAVTRLQPGSMWRSALRTLPVVVLPLVTGVMLWNAVVDGNEGAGREKKARDYWRQNLATWADVPQPAIRAVDLDLALDPAHSGLKSRGSYEMVNEEDKPMRQIALTGGAHWEHVKWTLDGRPYKPEDRTRLYVFTPPAPLPPGGVVRIGFQFDGRFPDGISKNGGGRAEFILPGGTVLTGFSPSFSPLVGYQKDIGIEKDENDYEPRVFPPDFYVGRTRAAFGLSRGSTTRMTLHAPAEYTLNGVGTLISDRVSGGQRTSVWASDHPMRLFNVVAGRWKVRRGQGTAIYYDPQHPYNIAEMSHTLDAARRYYSEWFYPFPWRELKISEFPALAGYAQGFPTNISFSEAIGFLTKPDVKTDAVFMVTAHESAHQWWGNILTPGDGPGGNILSEGMAHFSTALLFQQVKGERARMEFLKRIEESYGDNRRKDAERPLVLIDGAHDGDQTVTYDKGGWVFFMLLEHMGRERALAGLRSFIQTWKDGPDFPVLQDFTAAMRPFASDAAAFDAFVEQWFHQVVVPEYELSAARLTPRAGGARVVFQVKNAGTGRIPIELAAEAGERFAANGGPGKNYRAARTSLILGAGETRSVSIDCTFTPERVVVDPDVRVLQLRRKAAVIKL